MITIKSFPVNMISENCYIINDETKECVIIDDGAFYPEENKAIEKYIEDNHLIIKHLLCTHGHFDHIIGCQYIYDKYNIKPELHAADAVIYSSIPDQTRDIMGIPLKRPTPPIGDYLKEDDEVNFGNQHLKVIETPGHTPGGICFYDEKEGVLFSGDSLFQASIGRTDFPGGSLPDLINSLINKILTLPENVIVYTGHGPHTTIGQEKTGNPCL